MSKKLALIGGLALAIVGAVVLFVYDGERDTTAVAGKAEAESSAKRPTDAAPVATVAQETQRAPGIETSRSSPDTQPPAAAAPGKIRLEGVVRRPDGSTVADAVVALGGERLYSTWLAKKPLKDVRVATTGPDGRFVLADIEVPWVTLVALSEHGVPNERVRIRNEGRDRSDLELVLRVGGTIRGRVVRPDGANAPGRVVQLMGHATGMSPKVTTDEQGRFEQRGLVPGKYVLLTKPDAAELTACGIEGEPSLTAIVHMTQLSETVGDGQVIDLVLGERPPAVVRARGVVRRAGVPVSANLQWFGEGRDTYRTARLALAREDGRFEVELPEPGWFLVVASSDMTSCERRVRVEHGSGEIAFDFGTNAIQGRVVDPDGKPLEGQTVALTRERGAELRSFFSIGSDFTSTDAEGRYSFKGLDRGTYAVAACDRFPEGPKPWAILRVGGIEFAADGETRTIDLALRNGRAYTGRVVDEQGFPHLGANVFFFDAGPTALTPFAALTTNRDGVFKTNQGLPDGPAWVFAAWGEDASAIVELPPVTNTNPDEVVIQMRKGAWLAVSRGEELGWSSPEVFDAGGRRLTGLRFLTDQWNDLSGRNDPNVWRFGPWPEGRVRVVRTNADGRTVEREVLLVAGEERALSLP